MDTCVCVCVCGIYVKQQMLLRLNIAELVGRDVLLSATFVDSLSCAVVCQLSFEPIGSWLFVV